MKHNTTFPMLKALAAAMLFGASAPLSKMLLEETDPVILAALLYHGLRREELCGLRVKDMQSRQGVVHFRVKGKRDKIRFVPVHAMGQRLIEQ